MDHFCGPEPCSYWLEPAYFYAFKSETYNTAYSVLVAYTVDDIGHFVCQVSTYQVSSAVSTIRGTYFVSYAIVSSGLKLCGKQMQQSLMASG